MEAVVSQDTVASTSSPPYSVSSRLKVLCCNWLVSISPLRAGSRLRGAHAWRRRCSPRPIFTTTRRQQHNQHNRPRHQSVSQYTIDFSKQQPAQAHDGQNSNRKRPIWQQPRLSVCLPAYLILVSDIVFDGEGARHVLRHQLRNLQSQLVRVAVRFTVEIGSQSSKGQSKGLGLGLGNGRGLDAR